MESYTQFQSRNIQEIIPESQNELLSRILPTAVAIKEGGELADVELTEFCYLVKIWRDREVLWAQYPAGLLSCKTIGDLVDYLYRRQQSKEQSFCLRSIQERLKEAGHWWAQQDADLGRAGYAATHR